MWAGRQATRQRWLAKLPVPNRSRMGQALNSVRSFGTVDILQSRSVDGLAAEHPLRSSILASSSHTRCRVFASSESLLSIIIWRRTTIPRQSLNYPPPPKTTTQAPGRFFPFLSLSPNPHFSGWQEQIELLLQTTGGGTQQVSPQSPKIRSTSGRASTEV